MLFENNKDFYDALSAFGFDLNRIFNMQNQYRQNESRDTSSDKFVSAKEGFTKGNLYRNEYIPYKNYVSLPLKPNSEKEEKLFRISELEFALIDLSFHLNLHPEDQKSFELFKDYAHEYEMAKKEYEKKYGPLTLEASTGQVYEWSENPWPWDQDRGDKYV